MALDLFIKFTDYVLVILFIAMIATPVVAWIYSRRKHD